MRRSIQFLFRLLLLNLICLLHPFVGRIDHAASQTPNQTDVQQVSNLESRKQARAELLGERERLLETNDYAQLILTLNRLANVNIKLRDFSAALTATVDSVAVARRAENQQLLIDSLCSLA